MTKWLVIFLTKKFTTLKLKFKKFFFFHPGSLLHLVPLSLSIIEFRQKIILPWKPILKGQKKSTKKQTTKHFCLLFSLMKICREQAVMSSMFCLCSFWLFIQLIFSLFLLFSFPSFSLSIFLSWTRSIYALFSLSSLSFSLRVVNSFLRPISLTTPPTSHLVVFIIFFLLSVRISNCWYPLIDCVLFLPKRFKIILAYLKW